jgi:hypothetical protein
MRPFLIVALCIAPVAAHAAPATDADGPRWYGGQVILAELGSMLLVPVGVAAKSGGLASVGLLGMALSPAIVHGNHGNGGRGFASIAFHVGAGLAGGLVGEAASGEGPLAKLGGAAAGLFVSQIVATAVDAAWFAYEDHPPSVSVGVLLREPAADRRRTPAGLAVTLRF